jgi:purine-binding chemotaxis protein CheW
MADQDDITTEATPDHSALRQRLTLLERELVALRRELTTEIEPAALPTTTVRVLTMRIGEDVYGAPIEAIVEILRYVRLTQVPEVSAGIVGALNLRGSVHAVLDARKRFGLASTPPRLGTSIVLITVGKHRIGLLVDRVLEVISLEPGQLEPAGGPLASSGVFALATVGTQLIQLIDTAQLLQPHVMRTLDAALESIPVRAADGGAEHGR